MSTLGDPLLDLGWMLATWRYPGQDTVLGQVLMDADGLATPDESGEPLRAEHHPRPVEYQLVHGDGLLQARHHPGRFQCPRRSGLGAQGNWRPPAHRHGAAVRARTRTDRWREPDDRFRDSCGHRRPTRRDPRLRDREGHPVRNRSATHPARPQRGTAHRTGGTRPRGRPVDVPGADEVRRPRSPRTSTRPCCSRRPVGRRWVRWR